MLTDQMVATGRHVGDKIETATGKLATQIEQFTEATEASGTQMNRWTFWMMVSSGVLAALTVVQVVIAVWSAMHPDKPQIVIMPR
jgi:ribose/xylose/arabinose/galactoside ABC-type transport system permease subunit